MPNRTLMLIFWYQKMIFWYQKLISYIRKYFSYIRKSISDIRKCVNFWYQKTIFWYQKIIFWHQKLLSDIRKCHDFLISEIVSWYQKLFSDIRNYFLISEYQNFLVFAKINRYFIMFVVLESKLGHDPVVTSSQKNVMKCTTPEYSCKPCKLHKIETCHLKFKIHLCRLLGWKIFSGKQRNNVTSLWNVYTCSDALFPSSVFMLN